MPFWEVFYANSEVLLRGSGGVAGAPVNFVDLQSGFGFMFGEIWCKNTHTVPGVDVLMEMRSRGPRFWLSHVLVLSQALQRRNASYISFMCCESFNADKDLT